MPKQTFLNLSHEKRQTIVNAAADEFSEYGFEAASINRIVANSGISKGSFYQYFEDKTDVFRHLVDVLANEKAIFYCRHCNLLLPKCKSTTVYYKAKWKYGCFLYQFR